VKAAVEAPDQALFQIFHLSEGDAKYVCFEDFDKSALFLLS